MPFSKSIHNRLDQIRSTMKAVGLDILALNPGPSLVYFTGLHFHLMERPILYLMAQDQKSCLVLPELEMAKLAGFEDLIQGFPYPEAPDRWPTAFLAASQQLRLSGKSIGLEHNHLRLLEYQFLKDAAAGASFVPAEKVVAKLRMYKDEAEIQAMQRAAQIAETALTHSLDSIRLGMTEIELAGELVIQLLKHGSNPKMPFSPIVSFGPNSANPHASPTSRALQNGDLLLIDWGAAAENYISDITRTFLVGDVPQELKQIGAIVKDANEAARAVVRPGVSMATVDKAARAVIESAGYGKYFTHRTGHGIGMEGHEEPYIRADNDQLLEEGMTFTIEPGIYLPGRGGVRIEDDVLVTKDGIHSFSTLPRELKQIL